MVLNEGQRGVMFLARGRALFTLFEGDLDVTVGESLDSTSTNTLRSLQAVVKARRDDRRPGVVLLNIGLAVGATILLVLFLKLAAFLAGRIRARLSKVTQEKASRKLGYALTYNVQKAERALLQVLTWVVALSAVNFCP